eukprot:scaffold69569_cov63-Phaeocystis_antarctica.AAC.3
MIHGDSTGSAPLPSSHEVSTLAVACNAASHIPHGPGHASRVVCETIYLSIYLSIDSKEIATEAKLLLTHTAPRWHGVHDAIALRHYSPLDLSSQASSQHRLHQRAQSHAFRVDRHGSLDSGSL